MQEIDLNHLFVVLLAGLVTYVIRASFVANKNTMRFSKLNKMMLDHIPTACFSALIVSMLLITPDGLNFDFYKVISVMIALICGIFYKNFLMVIVSGMLSLWVLKYLFS